MKLTLIKEEQPFLVAGYSTIAKQMVFGFPYFHKENTEPGTSKVCPCIILPVANDGIDLPVDSPYDFACLRGEFHPIERGFHRFLHEDESGIYHFEHGITIKTNE